RAPAGQHEHREHRPPAWPGHLHLGAVDPQLQRSEDADADSRAIRGGMAHRAGSLSSEGRPQGGDVTGVRLPCKQHGLRSSHLPTPRGAEMTLTDARLRVDPSSILTDDMLARFDSRTMAYDRDN